MQLSLCRTHLEPRIIPGGVAHHVHNGGLPKGRKGPAFTMIPVQTFQTIWVPKGFDEVAPARQPVPLRRDRRAHKAEVRRDDKKLLDLKGYSNDVHEEQKAMEIELRALGYTWRAVEKLCKGRFPATAAEFLARYAPQPEALAA